MKNINLNRLFYFHTFVRKKSVVEAAKELLISQPALSSQLKQIELDFGVSLFDRSTRNLELTEKGQHLFYFTKRIFQTCESMIDELKPSVQVNSETFRIGISDQLERPFCVQFLGQLLQGSPTSETKKVSVISSQDSILLDKLRGGEINFLLTSESVEDDFVVPVVSKTLPVVLALPRSYRGHKTPAISSECIKAIAAQELRLVVPGPRLKLRQRTDEFLTSNGISPQIAFEADILAMLIRAVSDGVGAGFLPLAYLSEERKSDRIKLAGLPNGYWQQQLWLIVNKNAFSPATLEEIKAVFEAFA